MDVVDVLLATNRIVELTLFAVAQDLKAKGDNRWFFAYAHASITRRINKGIRLFDKPADLLLFNMNFAGRFLEAISKKDPKGVPPHWKEAFDFCGGWGIIKRASRLSRSTLRSAQEGSADDLATLSPMLACAQKMASAHINVDIKTALQETQCRVSSSDFGNMLYYIEEGAQDALNNAYGETVGQFMAVAKEMTVHVEKEWRNAVRKSVCGDDVPDPDPDFKLKSWQLEHPEQVNLTR